VLLALMIRSKTTFVIGAGASAELSMPSGPELMARIAQALDFERYGAELQTRDSTMLLQHLSKAAARMGNSEADMHAAAKRLRTAAKMADSIDSILEQQSGDPLVTLCGKLAIAHFISQAEAKSTLRLTPRIEGDLPLQGTDVWLFHLAKLITSGVPRLKAEKCLDDLSIVNFNYDRSIEHFLPHAFVMAFGMTLQEAQRIISAKLRVLRPFGMIGRLPWQPGNAPDLEWGTEAPWNLHNIATQILTFSERLQDQQTLVAIQHAVATARRLVILGFSFQPQNVDLMFERGLSHQPEVLITLFEMAPTNRAAVIRTVKRKTGLEKDELLNVMTARCYELMRDYSMMLES
jgi:hypothetical protein